MANIKLRTFKEISTQTAVFKMDIRHKSVDLGHLLILTQLF